MGEKVLSLLVQMYNYDVNKGGGPLEVLEVDVPEDPGVDDHTWSLTLPLSSGIVLQPFLTSLSVTAMPS